MHHFAAARGATIVEVTIMGPYVITYVNPWDEPWAGVPQRVRILTIVAGARGRVSFSR